MKGGYRPHESLTEYQPIEWRVSILRVCVCMYVGISQILPRSSLAYPNSRTWPWGTWVSIDALNELSTSVYSGVVKYDTHSLCSRSWDPKKKLIESKVREQVRSFPGLASLKLSETLKSLIRERKENKLIGPTHIERPS